MIFKKTTVMDIGFSILLCIVGMIGYMFISTYEKYNYFIVIYVLLNICLLPIYFVFLIKNKFPICICIPLGFIFIYIYRFREFGGINSILSTLIHISILVSFIYGICTTIFIHSHKPIQNNMDDNIFQGNILFKKCVFKRLLLCFRDMILVFFLLIGIIFYTNIAFDSSNIIEVEVTVINMDEREWKFDRTLYVEYFGSDSTVDVTQIYVPNYIADTISVGDQVRLNYRRGFFNDPYFWIVK